MKRELAMRYDALALELRHRGLNHVEVRHTVRALPTEISWGIPVTALRDGIADAALVHRLTGACASLLLEVTPDATEDWGALARLARESGIRLGTVSLAWPEGAARAGDLFHADPAVRAAAADVMITTIGIARAVGAGTVRVTLPPVLDPDDLRDHQVLDALQRAYAALPVNMTLLLEDLPIHQWTPCAETRNWIAAKVACTALGPQARVLLHVSERRTNLMQVVRPLLDLDRLGGCHIAGDARDTNPIATGGGNPYLLFSIFEQIVGYRHEKASGMLLLLGGSADAESRIEEMLLTVMRVQLAYAKALCIDADALAACVQASDGLGYQHLLYEAFETDVRPLLAMLRDAAGLPIDPFTSYREGDLEVDQLLG